MNFTFSAINSQGLSVRERLEAESEQEALEALHNRGLTVLALSAPRQRPHLDGGAANLLSSITSRFAVTKRVRPEQIVALTRELSILIETGVPLLDGVEVLIKDEANPTVRRALLSFRKEINEGRGMADVMAGLPQIFPANYVRMVRTAEKSGKLDETLSRAADYLEKTHEMWSKVQSALTYPKILLFITLGVTLFMLLFLIPRFQEMFTRMNAPLPLYTQLLVGASKLLRERWWVAALLTPILALSLRASLRHPIGQRFAAFVLLRLPVAGDLIRRIETARLIRSLGALLDAGVSLLEALETAGYSVQHRVFTRAVETVRRQVAEGQPIAAAFAETRLFPTALCQIMAVGEKSGRLSAVLIRMAAYYEQEVDNRLKKLSTLLEPLMVVFLAVVVGMVAVAVILPIYSLMDNMK